MKNTRENKLSNALSLYFPYFLSKSQEGLIFETSNLMTFIYVLYINSQEICYH